MMKNLKEGDGWKKSFSSVGPFQGELIKININS